MIFVTPRKNSPRIVQFMQKKITLGSNYTNLKTVDSGLSTPINASENLLDFCPLHVLRL